MTLSQRELDEIELDVIEARLRQLDTPTLQVGETAAGRAYRQELERDAEALRKRLEGEAA